MSLILSSILKKKVPEWNEKIYTETDIDYLSETLKLPVIEDEIAKAKGEYLIDEGLPFILLKPNLRREMKLWVTLHEIGHHLLHYPVNHKFSKGVLRRMDREANFFAAVALIPTYLLKKQTLPEIIAEYNYPREIDAVRHYIAENYKI